LIKGLRVCCFVAGTPIHTDKGLVPIEEIKVGDKVLSYNEKTKRFEYKQVAQTFTGTKENLVHLKIKGEKKSLTTTTEHPFYIKKTHKARDALSSGDNDDNEEGDWVDASKLKVGDKVLRPNGKWSRITQIEYERKQITVYNFEVEGNHSYFVGDVGMLSHNCNFSAAEQAIADYLTVLGRKVTPNTLQGVIGAGRQGDALIDGVLHEFKTLAPGATSSTIRNVVNNSIRRGGQARNIVIDARGSGLSEADALEGATRALGISRGRIDNISIIGDGYFFNRTP
jgi:hypothetical protein